MICLQCKFNNNVVLFSYHAPEERHADPKMWCRMFIKNAPNSHGFVNPRDIEDIWRDHFDYFYREYDEFIFPITIHPDVSTFLCDENFRTFAKGR